jgi:hypothetical protein
MLGTGAFHPKTYFFGNASEGVLLIGSGNLTMSGLERGREVFSAFRSTKPDDLGSIRGWRQWMDGIVERIDDEGSEISVAAATQGVRRLARRRRCWQPVYRHRRAHHP